MGQAVTDTDCAEPRSKFAYWGGKGNWMRFDVTGPQHAGRYLLLLEYATPDANPSLTVEVTHGNRKQVAGPVKLPRSWDWNCKSTRSMELGEFEIAPGTNQLLLTHAGDVGVDVFSLRLVRLPESEARTNSEFSFQDFHCLRQSGQL